MCDGAVAYTLPLRASAPYLGPGGFLERHRENGERNPLANGLFWIFSCVICSRVGNAVSTCRVCHLLLPPTNLVILVGGDSSELSSGEDEGVAGLPVQVVDVVRLHNVQPRLVAVHAVHNDLCNE